MSGECVPVIRVIDSWNFYIWQDNDSMRRGGRLAPEMLEML